MKGYEFKRLFVGFSESGLRGYCHVKYLKFFDVKPKGFKENLKEIAEEIKTNPAIGFLLIIILIVLSVLLFDLFQTINYSN